MSREGAKGVLRGLVWAIAVLVVTSAPYAYAALTTPDDKVYTGLMFNVPDHSQYWSWVTASRGGLFISNTMTPEPNAPVFLNGMMWLLAQVQTAFDLSFPELFQFWRVVGIFVLVPALLLFCRIFGGSKERQRSTAIILMAGAGLGWTLVVAKKLTGAGEVPWPLDLYIVEPNTFWTLLGYPYYAFAEGLLLLTLIAAWWAHHRASWLAVCLASLGALSLSFVHAYDLIIVYAILGAFGLVTWVRTARFPRMLFITGVAIGVSSAPLALYYARLTAQDPLWQAVLSQYPNAGVWTPSPPHLLILMGIPLLLAAIALFSGKPRDDAGWFVTTWAIVGAVLIYLPTVYQVKMMAGWQIPLSVLAAQGWHDRVLPALQRWRPLLLRGLLIDARRPLITSMLLLLLIAPTNVYLFAWRFVDLSRHDEPYFLRRDEALALSWLSTHATEADVVLAPLEVGRFVPNYGGSRAYLAHWAMTNKYFERVDKVSKFFAPETPDSWRESLVRDEDVTLVLRRSRLDDPAVFDPGQSAFFEAVLLLPEAQIYRRKPVTDPQS